MCKTGSGFALGFLEGLTGDCCSFSLELAPSRLTTATGCPCLAGRPDLPGCPLLAVLPVGDTITMVSDGRGLYTIILLRNAILNEGLVYTLL